MITIATYRNLMSAELAKTRLEFYDIKAMIADACFYTLGYGAIMDGVRLQVPATDAERAKEILATEEYVELPNDSTIIAESPETDVISAEAFKESAAYATSSWPGKWSVLLLFLFGIFCLILGRPTSDWRTMSPFSGQLILLGEMLIVAGLWIAYGHLSAAGEHEMPPE
ncbi:MAG: DUF2007 domain-containing protein [Verrucomicrobia bacterium]|nr:DUF2007 domain-containing protein [Verrucomicrobiota bacterium]MBU1734490.1 DUF2007 domain-containing protein [Verrucomicrobiota bacterium]MBU1856460.1 DUF2007 domain-containing protein [Verrucomicrobiota bacterium]